MCASWVGGYNHDIIIEKLNRGRHITKDGKVQYKGDGLDELFTPCRISPEQLSWRPRSAVCHQ